MSFAQHCIRTNDSDAIINGKHLRLLLKRFARGLINEPQTKGFIEENLTQNVINARAVTLDVGSIANIDAKLLQISNATGIPAKYLIIDDFCDTLELAAYRRINVLSTRALLDTEMGW